MSHFFLALTLCAGVVLSSCQKSSTRLNTAIFEAEYDAPQELPLTDDADHDALYRRVQTFRMILQGYKELAKKVLSFDAGVKQKMTQSGELSCTLLKPRAEKPIVSQPWAPFDFYGNVLSDEEHKDALTHIENRRDIFFVGDDNNRNGRQDSAEWTMPPHPAFSQSLHFTHFVPHEDRFQFFAQFSRGTRDSRGLVQFSGLLGAKAYPGVVNGKRACTARATLCTHYGTDAAGRYFCAVSKDHPAYELHQIRAQFDYPAAAKDYLTSVKDERYKHDIKELVADVRPLGSDGNPSGSIIAISLAKKAYYKNSGDAFEAEELPQDR